MTTDTTQNPLLEIRFQIPFDQIKAEHVEPAIEALLADARERQKALSESTGPRTYDNTLGELERMTERLEYAMRVIGHLEAVATNPELRAAYNAVQPPVSEFSTNIVLDPGLWRVLNEYAATPEAQSLTPTKRRFLTKTIDSFRRHGAELNEEGKKRLAELDIELTLATTKFAENVLDSTNDFELIITDEAKLAGLPESALAAARENAKSKGKEGWRFTLQAPSYTPLMTYLNDGEIRHQVYQAFVTRATSDPHDNRPLVASILRLRQEKAALLGYRNFADLVVKHRMAHTGENALKFLEDLHRRTERRFAEENSELQQFRKKTEGEGAPEIQGWDIAYYAEKQRAALYDFDEEELRPYFSLEPVVNGMFEIVRRLYGINVVEETGAPVWADRMQYYSILDSDGVKLGSFYADWYPRENKRGGAWMDAFITGQYTQPSPEPHLGLICGNLTPPLEDKPALLNHREVETIFHEFGHLLHHLLSKVEVKSLAGTNVAWDFVELPSQIMENWCWERESLDVFASHYQTGERIPEDLFQKMKRARNFRSANAQMRQLGFGILDLKMHIEYKPDSDGDAIQYAREMIRPFVPAPLPVNYSMVTGFTHLFASPVGYGAGYYSYKWAEVLDADAFSRFQDAGIFNPEVGKAFRDEILSRGDSEDPAQLFRSFMGRDPDVNALLVRSGLA